MRDFISYWRRNLRSYWICLKKCCRLRKMMTSEEIAGERLWSNLEAWQGESDLKLLKDHWNCYCECWLDVTLDDDARLSIKLEGVEQQEQMIQWNVGIETKNEGRRTSSLLNCGNRGRSRWHNVRLPGVDNWVRRSDLTVGWNPSIGNNIRWSPGQWWWDHKVSMKFSEMSSWSWETSVWRVCAISMKSIFNVAMVV